MDLLGLITGGLTAGTNALNARDAGMAERRKAARDDLLARIAEERASADSDMRRETVRLQQESTARGMGYRDASEFQTTTPMTGAPGIMGAAAQAGGQAADALRRGPTRTIGGREMTFDRSAPRPGASSPAPYRAIGGKGVLNTSTGEVSVPEALQSGGAAASPMPQRGTPEFIEYERQLAQARASGSASGRPAASDRVAATTVIQLAENFKNLDLVREALAAVDGRPQSFGLRRGAGLIPGMGQLGETINQRADPEGITARQLVGQVSAMKIKDISGAAVTVSEFPRLAAFVPLVWDTPEKIRANLLRFERELQLVTEALQNGATLASMGAGGAASDAVSTSTGRTFQRVP